MSWPLANKKKKRQGNNTLWRIGVTQLQAKVPQRLPVHISCILRSWTVFYDFWLSVESLLLFMYCFLDFIDCLSVFSSSFLSFNKTIILNSLSGNSSIFISLGLFKNYCFPLGVPGFLDILCSLRSCLTIFTFEETVTSLVFTYWIWKIVTLIYHSSYT